MAGPTPAERMVAEQLVPHGVTDPRVLDVMRSVPREEFLSGRAKRFAYEDRALAIDCGQEDDRDVLRARPALDVGRGLVAVHLGHLHVENGERDVVLQQQLQRLGSRSRFKRREPVTPQEALQR